MGGATAASDRHQPQNGAFARERESALTAVNASGSALLVGAVAAVGVLHTIVPDHWAPITILARQQGWSRSQVVRAAAIAGSGHTVSTLVIALLVWTLGAAVAAKYGNLVTTLSSVALIAFGLWIAAASLIEMRKHHQHQDPAELGHGHRHRHADGLDHQHFHKHHTGDWHPTDGSLALASTHIHEHRTSSRTALLLIIGSSPMVEGIPAFFAAAKYGLPQLVIMTIVFAATTILTYIAMSVMGVSGLQRVSFGKFERYGEVLSGGFIAATGFVFMFFL